jgi:hypothetical protein
MLSIIKHSKKKVFTQVFEAIDSGKVRKNSRQPLEIQVSVPAFCARIDKQWKVIYPRSNGSAGSWDRLDGARDPRGELPRMRAFYPLAGFPGR